MKAWYSQKLLKQCQRGEFQSAVSSVNEMLSRGLRITHYDCSALLYGAIVSRQPAQHHWIWNDLMKTHDIQPNAVTYSLAISAASRCHEIEIVKSLADEMKMNHLHDMDHKTWNQLLDSLGRIHDVDEMMEAMHAMKQSNCSPDSCTIATVLSGCIRSQRYDLFECVLEDILSSDESVKLLVDKHVMVTIMDGITRSGQETRVYSIWTKIIDCGVVPNANCYGTAILSFSKMRDQKHAIDLVMENVAALKREHAECLREGIDGNGHRLWHQILMAYSNLKMYDQMWMEYEQMQSILIPNAVTFSILAHHSDGEEGARRALEEVRRHRLSWDECSHRELKGFWRVAERLGNVELMKELRPILERKHENVGVVAILDHRSLDNWNDVDSEKMQFDNFYGEEDSNVLLAVDHLIKQCDHHVDVGQHVEVDEYSARKLISYHAEKKALAYALQKGATNITMRISLRMCPDCHRFFCTVSSQPQYCDVEITVYDSKTRHCFKHGECSCNDNDQNGHQLECRV